MIDTPPASAIRQRPAASASQAWATATSAVEQAVCTDTLGPRRSNLVGDTRRQVILVVAEQGGKSAGLVPADEGGDSVRSRTHIGHQVSRWARTGEDADRSA